MKIKFLKEYKFLRGFENDVKLTTTQIFKDAIIDTVEDEVPDEDVQWLIDNGFAEKVDDEWPQEYDTVWSISSDGTPYKHNWRGYSRNMERKDIGNVFKTKEAAERFVNYLKAITTVRQDEGVLTPEKVRETLNQYGTVYTVGTNATALSVEHFYNASAGAVYFDTLYNANTSIGNHLDEWEIITNYDWSKE